MSIGDRDFVTYFVNMEVVLRAGEGTEQSGAFLGVVDELLPQSPGSVLSNALSDGLRLVTCVRIDRQFEEAFEILAGSDDALAQMANTAMEQTAGRYFLLWSLHKLGDLAKLRSYAERFLREAEQRGNIYARTTFRRLSASCGSLVTIRIVRATS